MCIFYIFFLCSLLSSIACHFPISKALTYFGFFLCVVLKKPNSPELHVNASNNQSIIFFRLASTSCMQKYIKKGRVRERERRRKSNCILGITIGSMHCVQLKGKKKKCAMQCNVLEFIIVIVDGNKKKLFYFSFFLFVAFFSRNKRNLWVSGCDFYS